MLNNTLSILVPCYNQGAYLRQCLDSILAQKVPPDEVIVSDNHSTDETSLILNEYKHLFKIVRPNQFLPGINHFNYLFSSTTCAWGAIVCSDDWILPDFVSSLFHLINKYKDISLVRGGWHCVDGSGQIISTRRLLSVKRYTPSPENFLETIVGPKSPLAGWAANIRLFQQIGFFDVNADLLDWTAMIALSDLGSFATTHKPIACYRVNYRPGLQELRIKRQLEACFYIADTYLLPRADKAISRRMVREFWSLRQKIAGMLQKYSSLFGEDSNYVHFASQLSELESKLYLLFAS
jgi:glycosyltransferase involved in cell wall biosynthesis